MVHEHELQIFKNVNNTVLVDKASVRINDKTLAQEGTIGSLVNKCAMPDNAHPNLVELKVEGVDSPILKGESYQSYNKSISTNPQRQHRLFFCLQN